MNSFHHHEIPPPSAIAAIIAARLEGSRNYEGAPMHINLALQIIDTLAQGINPITGEAMPDDSPYNAPPIIRALHAVLRALEDTDLSVNQAPARRERPANAGKPWFPQEDAALETAFDAGIAFKQVAQELGRTTYAVEQRLIKLGKIKT